MVGCWMLDVGWMVGESGIKANSAQFSWSLVELGNTHNSILAQFQSSREHSKCSIIILCDLFSGYVIVEFLESGTSTEVYHALLRVSRRHKRPVRIITDAGSQFLSLAKGSKIELASELGIAFQCLSPGTQFANRLGAID